MLSEPKPKDTIHDLSKQAVKRVFVRNGNSVKNLNTIAHISLLSIAIAAVITKKDVSYRMRKNFKIDLADNCLNQIFLFLAVRFVCYALF